MARNLFRIVLLLVLGFIVFVRFQPDTYRIERSATVSATPAVAYAQVADFHRWEGWSPWEHLDPQMKRDFTGPASGTGARYAWSGNGKAGAGSMTITEATPDQHVAIDLEFVKPFKSSSLTTFEFAPEGEGTKVTWVMSGRHNFLSKVMCLFNSMDKMVGPDFEKGLAAMSTSAAAAPAAPADTTAPAAPESASAK